MDKRTNLTADNIARMNEKELKNLNFDINLLVITDAQEMIKAVKAGDGVRAEKAGIAAIDLLTANQIGVELQHTARKK